MMSKSTRSREAAFAALAEVLHPDLRPLTALSAELFAIEDEMHSAIRAWLRCPPDRRPSAHALGVRIAEIAADLEGDQ
jgi:hypothetical protein